MVILPVHTVNLVETQSEPLVSLLAEYSGDLHPNSGTLLGVISPLLGELDPLRVGLWVVRVRVRDHRLAAFAWVKNKKGRHSPSMTAATRGQAFHSQPPCWATRPRQR